MVGTHVGMVNVAPAEDGHPMSALAAWGGVRRVAGMENRVTRPDDRNDLVRLHPAQPSGVRQEGVGA